MTHILHIDSSLFGDEGQSSKLAAEFVSKLRETLPESTYRFRSLSKDPVPHLDGERFAAFTTPVDQRSPAQQAIVAYSDQLIDELREAQTLILGMPLYNLGVPSTFKAWIDHLARSGETFRYTENGPKGLLDDGKKVYVLAARGGQYQGTPLDTQSDYIRHILGLMGISDIEFIYAEGLNMGSNTADEAIASARHHIQQIAA